jgi:glycosyltransferase involved in cell wall biosynthesis
MPDEEPTLRIAIIAPPWVPIPPPAYGGTETVLDALATGLQALGHGVLLYATGDSTCPVTTAWTLPRAADTVGITPATEIGHIVHAYPTAQEWGAHIIHDHTLAGPLYADRFAIPVVTTNHGPFDGHLGDYYRAIAPTVPVVAISHHQASTARRTPVSAIIHHGIDTTAHPVGDGRGGYALFLGRMTPDKGVHIAARLAHAAGIPLKIAAKRREPAEHSYFDHVVAPLLGRDVEYVGEVSGSHKIELLRDATCLLNPIRWPEPFGMVMIEALACGTPVVATPCGAVPEIVDDGITGFIRSTEADLIDALHRIDEIDRTQCRKVADERFTAHRMATDHLALYRRVVTQPTRLPYRRSRDRVTPLHIVGPITDSPDVTQLR